MLTSEREDAIVSHVRVDGSISVDKLASLLAVSGATIRRDLQRLEDAGLLTRVHGGATVSPLRETLTSSAEFNQEMVREVDLPEKKAIARAVASRIADGEVVLLDIGVTTFLVARHLRGREVTVITNNLSVLDALRGERRTRLIMLAGEVGAKPQTLVGPLTEESLASVRADVAVISSSGIEPDGAVVTDLTQEAKVKAKMIAVAHRSILVATHAKFPGTGAYRIASVTDFDVVVVGDAKEHVALRVAAQAGSEIIVA